MEIVIGLIIGLAIGFLVGKLLTAKSAGEEKTQLIAKTQVLTSENQMLKENQAKQVNDLKLQMQNERQYSAKLREEKSRASTRRLAPDRRLSEGILAR